MVQGLKGDATYLIVNEEGAIKDFALNAVCTHLGCVVPWNKAENKFMCPCHGSQYNSDGMLRKSAWVLTGISFLSFLLCWLCRVTPLRHHCS